MKTTDYFRFIRLRPDRKMILDTWILQIIENPVQHLVQEDGRIRLWGRIAESENRVLRVVLLEDGQTVHNAFFDRGFKGADS